MSEQSPKNPSNGESKPRIKTVKDLDREERRLARRQKRRESGDLRITTEDQILNDIAQRVVLEQRKEKLRLAAEAKQQEDVKNALKQLNGESVADNKPETKGEPEDPFEAAWKTMSEGSVDAVLAAIAVGDDLELNNSPVPARVDVGVIDALKKNYCVELGLEYNVPEGRQIGFSKKIMITNGPDGFTIYGSKSNPLELSKIQAEIRRHQSEMAAGKADREAARLTRVAQEAAKEGSMVRGRLGMSQEAFGELPDEVPWLPVESLAEQKAAEKTLEKDIKRANAIRRALGLSTEALGELPPQLPRKREESNNYQERHRSIRGLELIASNIQDPEELVEIIRNAAKTVDSTPDYRNVNSGRIIQGIPSRQVEEVQDNDENETISFRLKPAPPEHVSIADWSMLNAQWEENQK